MNLKKKIVDKSINYIKVKKLSRKKAMIVLFFGLTIGNILGMFEKIFKFVCNRKKIIATAFGVLVIFSLSVAYFFYVQVKEDDSKQQIYYNQETSTVHIVGDTRAYNPESVEKFTYIEGMSRYLLKVNRLLNYVTVYTYDSKGEYTVPVKAMLCSTGKVGHATPLGTYKLGDKSEWCYLVNGTWGQYACRINGPIMFHSVPYEEKSKDSLETEEYNKLGEAASLGCVRLAVIDEKWIYDNCEKGTLVEIYEDVNPGPIEKPNALDLSADTTWDPTDPDVNNPFN